MSVIAKAEVKMKQNICVVSLILIMVGYSSGNYQTAVKSIPSNVDN